jgi:hypothetical protein
MPQEALVRLWMTTTVGKGVSRGVGVALGCGVRVGEGVGVAAARVGVAAATWEAGVGEAATDRMGAAVVLGSAVGGAVGVD